MSEYVPTTKDVREVWIYAQDITHDEGEDFHGAEFDRWLAAHDAEVRAGVVAEEPEWRTERDEDSPGGAIERRVTPWVLVKQGGAG